jgi:hypothetical protein
LHIETMATEATAVRVARDLVDAARAEAQMMHRSVSQQIEHWAMLGRALEQSSGVSMQRVRDCLEGARNVDDLSNDERAVVLAGYERRLADLDASALEADLAKQARYVSDGKGGTTEISPSGARRAVRGSAVLARAQRRARSRSAGRNARGRRGRSA